jgi:hypothetical protein
MCGCALLAYLGFWQLTADLPRTVVFDAEQWENHSWGLHNIERSLARGTVAVSADGSRANTLYAAHYEHYLFKQVDSVTRTVYLRPAHVAYRVDEKARTTVRISCNCTWDGVTPPASDAECSTVAKVALGDGARRIGVDVVAGIPVIRYKVTKGRSEHEGAFAPKYGCDFLEEIRGVYNMIGLPISRYHFVVRSYAPGEPLASAFQPPAGYSVAEATR